MSTDPLNYPIDNSQKKEVVRDSPDSAPASDVCPICFGTGQEVVPGKGARRCVCRLKNQRDRLLAEARIPKRYEACSLQNYYPGDAKLTQQQAFKFAWNLARDYPVVDRGLLLMGPVGVGKTHLCVAILRELIDRKLTPCLFYQFGSLLKEIQNSYIPVSLTS